MQTERFSQLIHEVLKGDASALETAVAAGLPVDYKDAAGSILFKLAQGGREKEIEKLLAYGAAVNLKSTAKDYSPLHGAALGESVSCVELLIQHGAKIDEVDNQGRTPLFLAVLKGNLPIIDSLLRNGANVNFRENKKGLPIIAVAVIRNDVQCLQRLLLASVDVNAATYDGKTALELAIEKDFEEIARLLILAGAAMDTGKANGDTLLHIACKYGSCACLRLLVGANCNIDAENNERKTALEVALKARQKSCAELLVEAGATKGNHFSRTIRSLFVYELFPLVCCVLLVIAATTKLPIGYYTFLKIVITIWGIITGIRNLVSNPNGVKVILSFGLAVLYNPLIEIHLARDTWEVINIISCCVIPLCCNVRWEKIRTFFSPLSGTRARKENSNEDNAIELKINELGQNRTLLEEKQAAIPHRTTWQKTKTSLSLIPFLAGSLGLVLGGLVLYIEADEAAACVKQVSSWKKVPAQIVEATTETTSSGWGNNRTTATDLISVKYKYDYNGLEYTSTDKGLYNEHDVQSIDKHPPLFYKQHRRREYTKSDFLYSDFSCFVNPHNPNEAKLFCNPSESNKSIACILLVMGIIGSGAFGFIMYRCLTDP